MNRPNPGVQPGPDEAAAPGHALVTGATRGIGAAIAHRLAREGWRVTLLGRDAEALQAVAAALPVAPRGASSDDGTDPGPHGWVQADVTDEAAVRAAFDRARGARGPLSALVNNAGVAESAPALRTDRALWERLLAVNLTGAWLCGQAALPDLLAQARAGRRARLVQVASTAGQRGYPYVSAYVAAKHGLVGLTRAWAVEFAAEGLTVNAVCPGFTDTDLLARSVDRIVERTGRDPAAARQALAAHNPQGRLVQPHEVAAVVAFLCGPEAGSITGQCLSVSGGEVMA